jgi:hypothetical protein
MRDDIERKERAEYQKALRAAHTERGQCIECVEPHNGTRRCDYHQAKHNRRLDNTLAMAHASGLLVLAIFEAGQFRGWKLVPR